MKLISKYWWVFVLGAVVYWYFWMKPEKDSKKATTDNSKPMIDRRGVPNKAWFDTVQKSTGGIITNSIV